MNLIALTAPVADTDWGHMSDWGAGGWLAMAAFWVLVIVVVVWIASGLAGPRPQAPDAKQILERQFRVDPLLCLRTSATGE